MCVVCVVRVRGARCACVSCVVCRVSCVVCRVSCVVCRVSWCVPHIFSQTRSSQRTPRQTSSGRSTSVKISPSSVDCVCGLLRRPAKISSEAVAANILATRAGPFTRTDISVHTTRHTTRREISLAWRGLQCVMKARTGVARDVHHALVQLSLPLPLLELDVPCYFVLQRRSQLRGLPTLRPGTCVAPYLRRMTR
jgi:hypothetical protein